MQVASEKVFQADRVFGTPELETFLRMARVTRPGIGDEMSKKFVGKLQQDLEAEQAQKKKKQKRKNKSSVAANGTHGQRKEKRGTTAEENTARFFQNKGGEAAIGERMAVERER